MSDPNKEFIENIKKWVIYDNAIKKTSLQQTKLKEHKEHFENKIINTIQNNNMENIKLNIDNSKVFYKENNVNQPLTNKFLEEIFLEYFKNDRETKILMEFIKRKRENNKKTTFTLKRSLNK